MKFLKLRLSGKIFIFLAVFFGYSLVLVRSSFAITTESECTGSVPVAGVCKPSSVSGTNTCPFGEYYAGSCGESSGKICCIKYQEEGSACGYQNPLTGKCKKYLRVYGSGCDSSTEKKLTNCTQQPATEALYDLVCCVPKDDSSVSGSDVACSQACSNKYKCVSTGGCPSDFPKQNGNCGSNLGFEQKCCIPWDCNPGATGSGSTPSSGSASLKYTPLENLPGFENQGGDFAAYFGNLYKLALWIVGISALFMLVVGGFLYLSSAGNTALLGTAKKTIYSALIGLVIALVSWLLLDTINSDLTNLKLSGLSGAISSGSSSGTTGGTSGSSSTPTEYKGKGSGCSGAETQGAKVHCEDASQDLSDTLYCMVDKLKASGKKIQISSISEDSGGKSLFTQCRDNWTQPPCEHGKGSCHYGGSVKNDKSCAADISGSYINGGGSAASASEVKDVAGKCGAQINDEMGKSSGAHIHVSVKGCGCL